MSELKRRLSRERDSYGQTKRMKREKRTSRAYPQHAEPALVHPSNKSTVKMRDSGAIDIFVGTNNGIRVDPGSRTIKKISNHEHALVGAVTETVSRNRKAVVGQNWTVQTLGGDIVLEANGRVIIKSKYVDVSVEHDFTVRAKNIDLFATENVNLSAKDIFAKADDMKFDGKEITTRGNKMRIASKEFEIDSDTTKVFGDSMLIKSKALTMSPTTLEAYAQTSEFTGGTTFNNKVNIKSDLDVDGALNVDGSTRIDGNLSVGGSGTVGGSTILTG